jgi:hypothetical protein
MQVIAEALTGAAQTPLALRVHVATGARLRCAVLAYGRAATAFSGALWLHEIKHNGSGSDLTNRSTPPESVQSAGSAPDSCHKIQFQMRG